MPKKQQTAKALIMQAEEDAKQRLASGVPILQSQPPVVNAAKDEATVYIYDAIGSWFGIDPKDFVPALKSISAKTIHLRINSPGGSVFDAEAMRTAIAEHPAHVIAHIDGLCASAATTIALAADEVEISAGSMFMIHNAWSCAIGNARDLRNEANLLDKVDENIAMRYVQKTGQSKDNIQNMMIAETWFSASEALDFGFVDRIFEAELPEDTDADDGDIAALAVNAELENFKLMAHRQILRAELNVAGLSAQL